MTPEELRVRANNAAQLLAHPLLQESLARIEAEVLAAWEACPARDVEGREELWKHYKVAKKFRGILQGMVEDGKMVAMREKEKSPFDKFVTPLTRVIRGATPSRR